MALKLRRGTEAQRIITPDQGELLYVTDTKKVYVGDGATVGGILVGPIDSSLVTDTSPQLGGNLDLNGKDITGTGNININGTITATGSINLGNGLEDNINVGGLISSSLNPSVDDSFNLGTANKQWANVWATQANIDTTLAVGGQIIKLTNGSIDSSIVLWDSETDTLTATEFVGDVTGSVFASDTTTLVDAVAGKIVGDIDNTTTTTKTINGSVMTLSGENELSIPAGIVVRTTGTEDDPYDLLTLSGASDTVAGPATLFLRSRGTHASPAPLLLGDKLLSQYWLGTSSDDSIVPVVGIQVFVDGTPGAGILPGRIEFGTADSSGVFNTGLSLDKDGIIGVKDNSLTVGGGSGEVNTGGTVKYIRINVGGTDYALPLYPLNP